MRGRPPWAVRSLAAQTCDASANYERSLTM
jgi:hypothetical protein